MRLNAYPGHLQRPESPTAVSWRYGAQHPIDHMLTEEYLRPLMDHVGPGDTIRITQYRDKDIFSRTTNRALAQADIAILSIEHKRVEFEVLTRYDFQVPKTAPVPDEPEYEREVFIDMDAEAVVRGRAGWCVVDKEGAVRAKGLDKATAERMARGDIPLP